MLKQSILHLYNSDLNFDVAPMLAVQHLSLYRQYRHLEDYYERNAFVSWESIIKKLEKEDDWKIIKTGITNNFFEKKLNKKHNLIQ